MSTPARLRPYTKPALPPAALLRHLADRGLAITDGVEALAILERIDYYRLLGYMRSFQKPDETGVRRFDNGTTLQDVLALYEFDRKLRLLSMDAAERLEVSLRAAIISEVAVAHGPHFYLESKHFTSPDGWSAFNRAVNEEKERSPALRHYFQTYGNPPMPPIWSAMEAVSFGTLSHLYSNLKEPIRKAIAKRFNYDEVIVLSWFRSTTMLRNLSAHHARLWNTRNGVDKPMRAKRVREEFGPGMNTFYARAVAVVALFEEIGHDLDWKARLRELIDAHPFVDESQMGFREGWRDRTFWSPAPGPHAPKQAGPAS
jgi:abortive infection bacteriophage resistance protein